MSRRLITEAPQLLRSKLDLSKNWIFPIAQGSVKGNLEARYVKRCEEYISIYVSSHGGCKMGCKFCYLTALNQTYFKHATIEDYDTQLRIVYNHYQMERDKTATCVNINYMARGEPLANKVILNNFGEWYERSKEICDNIKVKHNVSTIMPNTVKYHKMSEIFGKNEVYMYYSLYSVNPKFRKFWLPNAMDYNIALDKLKEFQEYNNQQITFHWAFIEGENDQIDDMKKLADVLRMYKFNGKFNLVRFNPPPKSPYREPHLDKLRELFQIVNDGLNNNPRSKIVGRVGEDIYASCGMFIDDID